MELLKTTRARAPRGGGRRQRSRPGGAALVAALLAWMAAGAAAAAVPPEPASVLEYDVKAAFLYNFAKFVEWPPEGPGGQGEPLNLCIFGEDPFGSRLDDLVGGERIEGRRIAVRRIRRSSELRSCHIVFLSRAERRRVPEAVAALRGRDVLTVGESEGFADAGGIIQLFVEANKVRFAVNLDALERTRLKVSSKLLRVARVVRPEGKSGGG